ncbi:MAG TPA: PAS domain S-box protein [Candidatus Binatia bacterium]|nr:PAS domain S-box protein [Candidatus Binatia bacterium]
MEKNLFSHLTSMAANEAEAVLKGLAGVFEHNPTASDLAAGFLKRGTANSSFRAPLPILGTRYQTLVEQIPAVIFMAALDGGISEAYVSPHIEAVLGYSQTEWLDDPVRWYRQIHPEDKERWSSEAAGMLVSGAPLSSVYRVLARDGHVVWLQCHAKMVRDEQGKPWFIHGLAVDITELRETQLRLEKAHEDLRSRAAQLEAANARLKSQIAEREAAQKSLRESEERFRLLVDGVKDYGLFMLDGDGYVVSWNQGAERLKGYSAEEIIGKHFSHFYLEQDVRRGVPEQSLRIARSKGRFETEGWRRRKNGSKFWANVLITALRDSAGQFQGFAKLTRDMSEQRAIREKLQEAERLAAMGTTAAAFAHEIGNPLNGISASLQFLQLQLRGKCDDAMVNETVDLALKEIDSLGSLLSDFRSLARPQQPQQLELQAVELANVAKELLASQSAKYVSLRIGAQLDCPMNLPPVMADPRKLKQALLNLCNNAVEAMPGGGSLTIRCRYSDGLASLEVSDTGVGIPDDFDIFQLFKTTKARGTGLGLAIVRQIVSAHQGTISYHSEPGKGTTFTLSFPVNT